MNKESKILVAGGSGLVGSSIIRNLLTKGYKNIISAANSNNSTMDNIKTVAVDFTSQKDTEIFFKEHKPEYFFLAAAKVGGIMANNIYRADFIYINLMIQNNIIHECWKNKVKKLLFLGSSCIYPKNCPQPMKEDYLLTEELEYTNEPYAIAKIAGIKMCESYNLQYGTNFISVMPTNLYGPNDNYDLESSHVLPAMIRKLHMAKLYMNKDLKNLSKELNIKQEEVTSFLNKLGINENRIQLWGTGTPKREFLYSDDLADAVVFLMKNINFSDTYTTDKEIRNTHINIGTGIDLSIRELAKIVAEIVEYNGNIDWDETKPDGTMQKLLCVEKLNSLGWKEKIDLKTGVKLAYEDFKKRYVV